MKLNKKEKRKVKRELDVEEGHIPPMSYFFKNKKKYNRKTKHNKKDEDN